MVAVQVRQQDGVDRIVGDTQACQGDEARGAKVDAEANSGCVDQDAGVETSPRAECITRPDESNARAHAAGSVAATLALAPMERHFLAGGKRLAWKRRLGRHPRQLSSAQPAPIPRPLPRPAKTVEIDGIDKLGPTLPAIEKAHSIDARSLLLTSTPQRGASWRARRLPPGNSLTTSRPMPACSSLC